MIAHLSQKFPFHSPAKFATNILNINSIYKDLAMKTQAIMALVTLGVAGTYGHGSDNFEMNGPPQTKLRTTHTYIDPVSNTQIDIVDRFYPYNRVVHITHYTA
jgi:hypothetical protein